LKYAGHTGSVFVGWMHTHYIHNASKKCMT